MCITPERDLSAVDFAVLVGFGADVTAVNDLSIYLKMTPKDTDRIKTN